MKSIWEIPFIVIDVETTGSDAVRNRVTEIACVTVKGHKIISEYHSLVNPHQFIPYFITNMTGITNEMVYTAPEPEIVFPKVASILSQEDAVFVAHNASFDWSFVMHSIARAELEPVFVPRLCTLKLARRIFPEQKKKNVGSLSEFLEIPIYNRHRALGDAEATAHILIELLERAESEFGIETKEDLLRFQNMQLRHFKPPCKTYKIVEPILKQVPEESGVYFFLDVKGNILYIGKAKSLKERVNSYFNNSKITSKKISEMLKRVRNIKWECTGTELSALILESKLIKKYKPQYNSMSKSYREFPFIKLTVNEDFPRVEKTWIIEADNSEYYGPFNSPFFVDNIIETIERQYKIRKCDNDINPNKKQKPCFYFHIHKCASPCSQSISKEDYLLEIEKIRYFLNGFSDGIIHQLERKMIALSEEQDFEKAAKLRNQIFDLRRILYKNNNIPTSIDKSNLIIILPASHREKLAEIFFIKSGKLVFQEIIGRKAPLEKIYLNIHKIFFNNSSQTLNYNLEDIDEIKIISHWLYKKQKDGLCIYPDYKAEDEVISDFSLLLRNLSTEHEDNTYEYES